MTLATEGSFIDVVLIIQTPGKSSSITESNTGSEIFKVKDSSFIAGLSSGGTITRVAAVLRAVIFGCTAT